MKKEIIIGRFASVYGVKGWIRINSFTDPKENILNLQPWFIFRDDKWQSIEIEDAKTQSNSIVVKIANINDRELVKTYTNIDIAIEKDQLPKLSANEYYWSDLEGLEVINRDGEKLGKVDCLFETGSNDVLVVKNKKQYLIPYTKHVIVEVNLVKKCIIVDWDADF